MGVVECSRRDRTAEAATLTVRRIKHKWARRRIGTTCKKSIAGVTSVVYKRVTHIDVRKVDEWAHQGENE
eukprot:scaffold28332_cov31-Tisochrysis_lutea.AAC.2